MRTSTSPRSTPSLASRTRLAWRLAAVGGVAALALTGCSKGSDQTSAAATATGQGSCPDVVATAQTAVKAATATDAPWDGPTTGATAQSGKTIAYVAQTMTNPGVAGVAKGIQEAAAKIGWDVRILDGQGDQAGIQNAFGQALALNPAGIVVGGFDPKSTQAQMDQAKAANIPVIGWHAVGTPGPSTDPALFTNVTTKVEDVAKISAQYIIAQSNGTAGVVVFTDDSIPFAAGKAQMIEQELGTCSSVKVLNKSNIPIPDAGTRTPQEFSSLASRLGDSWTYSVAINDLYFDNAATPLRAAGKQGNGAPYNVGAGDGSEAAFQRIASGQYQAATVPEPLNQEGWQIVDEFNRAFAGQQASGYVPAIHITDKDNVGTTTTWDPAGYREAYAKIWGK
ncbi:substrate-binding domain-containing protein [Quadrisphaera oryzae]|uniref:substrate-binding domain-containing protein n=1 Tax=Quadrisphaera TaxID=317661 RepID=UPI001645121E|nr:substrate-binding domain-containing protein [Quadrisphaera sp. RL12-1S]MBC3760779.1 substrate-binding domain-containing protein [Quadrisphaera sp. RL12-1S]